MHIKHRPLRLRGRRSVDKGPLPDFIMYQIIVGSLSPSRCRTQLNHLRRESLTLRLTLIHSGLVEYKEAQCTNQVRANDGRPRMKKLRRFGCDQRWRLLYDSQVSVKVD